MPLAQQTAIHELERETEGTAERVDRNSIGEKDRDETTQHSEHHRRNRIEERAGRVERAQ